MSVGHGRTTRRRVATKQVSATPDLPYLESAALYSKKKPLKVVNFRTSGENQPLGMFCVPVGVTRGLGSKVWGLMPTVCCHVGRVPSD